MANACKKPECRCEHIDCDYGWIYATFVTVEEKNTRKDGKIVVQTEYEAKTSKNAENQKKNMEFTRENKVKEDKHREYRLRGTIPYQKS